MIIKPFFENIKETLIEELNLSKSSLKVALAYFNDQDLFNVLCNKAAEGVIVELILSTEDINLTLDYNLLVKSGGKCFFSKHSVVGLMHHKFCIIDDSILITGSYNWTNKAASSNFENIVLIKDSTDTIVAFNKEFKKLLISSEPKLSIRTNSMSLDEILIDYQQKLESPQELKKKTISGYKLFDDLTIGFQNSGLYTIVSRPSVGSTSLALNIISNIIDDNKAVLLLSLDLNSKNIINRFLSLKSSVKLSNIFESSLSKEDNEQIKKTLNEVKQKTLFIDETPDITIKEIELLVIKLKQSKELDFVVIDNLELIKLDRNNEFSLYKTQRELEIDCILRELKRISKFYNIPILINTHLIKEADFKTNSSKTPRFSDTVSCIEHYSDVMVFLYRPEMYGYNEDEEGNSLLNLMEVIVSRNKFGKTGQFKMQFDKDFLKLSEFKYDYQNIDIKSDFNFVSKMNEPLEDDELY